MPREITVAEESALARYSVLGTPEVVESTIRKLKKENATRREENTKLKADLEGVPKIEGGGRFISKEDAAELDGFKALGKLAEVKAAVEKLPTVEATLAQRDREAGRDAAAKALGIEGKDLAPFAGADALTFETKDEEVDVNGKKEKRAVAYVTDAEKKQHKLADYGKEKWGRSFEGLLKEANQPPAPGGKPYTPTTGGSGKAPKNESIAKQRTDSRYVTPGQRQKTSGG